ncbi:MAG TPA: hypothetical protein ENI53_02890 [Thermoplasmatales archaeon]|nr:hypothetical protein [Thermoplasmatales archaeon]
MSWNATAQDFILYVPGRPYDFEIENGRGYLVGVTDNVIFSISGIDIVSVSVPLKIGWNMLGWFKQNETTASSLYNAIENCSIVLKWDAIQQDFILYVPGSPYNPKITRGDGFLVAVTEQSIWYGEG